MNKLGFYIHVPTIPGLVEAIQAVQPPVILTHADSRGLLRDIRRSLSPDSFVIGRLFLTPAQQDAILSAPDPEEQGRQFAERVLRHDFELARERAPNGRLLIDAWMSLNEAVPGPASLRGYQIGQPLETLPGFQEMARRADAFDRFQAAFLRRLHQEGLEGVAFNFATLNWLEGEHYIRFFPRTLAEARYLGFHEYGWPTMMEDPQRGTVTGCLVYRRVMTAIRRQYGDQHRVIITECGLARAVKHGMPDVGWLYEADPIPEDQYVESLRWYNRELCRDAYVLGGCLYEVGHAGDWYSFRHLGTDNRGNPLRVIEQLARFREEPMPEPAPLPEPVPPPPEPQPQPAPRVPAPAIEDVSAQLPIHPQRRYPQRAVIDIRRLIIHHTGISSDPDPEVIARYQVSQRGMPGIGYHFLIRFDGRIQQTQPLTIASAHTTRNNEDSVGIAFAGSFMQGIPTPAQLASGAHLCAYLLDQLGLPIGAILGRREVEGGTASPGSQWNEGLRWRETLLAGVTQRLEAAGVPLILTRQAGLAAREEAEPKRSPSEELAELQRLATRLQAEIAELADRLAALAEEMATKG